MFVPSARRALAILGLLACQLAVHPRQATTAAPASPCAKRHDLLFSNPAPPPLQAAVLGIACRTSLVRGLDPRRPVTVRVVDAATMHARVAQISTQDATSRPAAGDVAALQLLGVPVTAEAIMTVGRTRYTLDTAAQYDVQAQMLLIRSTGAALTPLDQALVARQYDYAMLDQNFGLASLLSSGGSGTARNSDLLLARQALVEGDVYTTMIAYASATFSAQDRLQFTQQLQKSSSTPIADFLHDQIGFPASQGATFVQALITAAKQGKPAAAAAQAANDALNQAFRNPPASTTEVLNPTIYLAHAQVIPVVPPLAGLGTAWSQSSSDVLGGFGINELLDTKAQSKAQSQAAEQAADHWTGDRWIVYQRGNDTIMTWRTRFVSAADAQGFISALIGYTGTRFHTKLSTQVPFNWATASNAMSIRQRDVEVVVAIGSNKDLLPQVARLATTLEP